ncbi:unnamed protein product [Ilex paraguariensis]|uniref:Mei2-like C-terminal RNA recognition motif domain-containing protein n=1 Tax=Ilex paraguariensis TaxID=185542 RepID=A0ABC8TQF5_9AQUA
MCRESTAMGSPPIPKLLDPNAPPYYAPRAENVHSHTPQNFHSPPPSVPAVSPPPPPPPLYLSPVQTEEPFLLSPTILRQQPLFAPLLLPPTQPVVGFPRPLPAVFYVSSPQAYSHGQCFYTGYYYASNNIQVPQQIYNPQVEKSFLYPNGFDHGVEVSGCSGGEVMETGKAGEKIEDLNSCFGREKKDAMSVPAGSRVRRWTVLEFGGKLRGRRWKPRKTKSEKGGATGSTSCPLGDDSDCENTTVMIKNIPNQFRRSMLLEILDRYCEEDGLEYDFVYLPFDFKHDNNLGYAFVNFTSNYGAKKVGDLMQNHKWGAVRSSKGLYQSMKICEIRWARIQGKNELVRHFQNSSFACSTKEYLPVVLSPPRNGSTSITMPITVGKCRASHLLP